MDFWRRKIGGEIDQDIFELLKIVNSLDGYVTLSSCSGRIAVIDIPEVGDKKAVKFLGKWHDVVECKAVINAALKSEQWGWLIQYPPILHVACRTVEDAERFMNAANQAGFRRSGIISLKNHVVEITSFERTELPIAYSKKLLVTEYYLKQVVEFANIKLKRGKEKLKRLQSIIKTFSE